MNSDLEGIDDKKKYIKTNHVLTTNRAQCMVVMLLHIAMTLSIIANCVALR